MAALIISLALIGLVSVVFFFTGLFGAGINALFRLAYKHHLKLRREQRPGRIILVRHGESKANLDPSKRSMLI
jgi:hypothetical protein